MACIVNEVVVALFGIMIFGGAGMILYQKYKMGNSEVAGHHPLSTPPSAYDSSVELLKIDPNHKEETAKFITSHLGHLISKHDRLQTDITANEKQFAYWSTFGKILGIWNLVGPAVSIILQGVLKVSDNAHHSDDHKYTKLEKRENVNIKDYDLDECARAFRQSMVALMTIVAIVFQSLNKVLAPDVEAGKYEEKLKSLRDGLKDFDNDLLTCGSSSGTPRGGDDGH